MKGFKGISMFNKVSKWISEHMLQFIILGMLISLMIVSGKWYINHYGNQEAVPDAASMTNEVSLSVDKEKTEITEESIINGYKIVIKYLAIAAVILFVFGLVLKLMNRMTRTTPYTEKTKEEPKEDILTYIAKIFFGKKE